jgi:hypothetical protein
METEGFKSPANTGPSIQILNFDKWLYVLQKKCEDWGGGGGDKENKKLRESKKVFTLHIPP